MSLGVSNLEKAKSFYTALGWQVHEWSKPNLVYLKNAGVFLVLCPFELLAQEFGVKPVKPKEAQSLVAFSTNQKSVENVDLMMAKAKESGASVLKPAQATSWGGYSGAFKDLDGYIWEVVYNEKFLFPSPTSLGESE